MKNKASNLTKKEYQELKKKKDFFSNIAKDVGAEEQGDVVEIEEINKK
jgi:hypothetical protein